MTTHAFTKNKASLWVAFVATCAMLLVSMGAFAATRAVPTKDVDEPGRDPYNVTVEFSETGCLLNCSRLEVFDEDIVLMDAPAVPDGKRLVVTWVSASLPSSSSVNSIAFQSSRIIANQRAIWQFHGPFFQAGNSGSLRGMSSGAFFTVEPLESPHIRLSLGNPNNVFGSISIGGYLIDAEN